MDQNDLQDILTQVQAMHAARPIGRVVGVRNDAIHVSGLGHAARLGDNLSIATAYGDPIDGEVVGLEARHLIMLPKAPPEGIALGDKVSLQQGLRLYPGDDWIGRVVDPNGAPLDGRPLRRGRVGMRLHRDPPRAVFRKPMGSRLNTGMVLFNTLLPIVTGQRIGLFAGSGVGKTSLLGHFAAEMQADVVVIALIGERGREVRHFVDRVLGKKGMARSVIVAATSDQSPLIRRQCPYAAMTIAEYFRDQGKSVLFLADSITRLAEAHREVAVISGEPPSLRGHPPSMTHMITSLCERAGTGIEGQGDITGIFSVLVAGSDMDEPVADTLRGVLDGHVVLDRAIAEQGRYPAVDVVRSISRSLPEAATDMENTQIARARKLLGAYAKSATMIRAGLYAEGNDLVLDQAVRVNEEFELLLSRKETMGIEASFRSLAAVLRAADAYAHAPR